MRSFWSSAIVHCAIGLYLNCLPLSSNGQVLYSSPSNIQHQYKPLINVAFPANESEPSPSPSRVHQGWTPVRNGANTATTIPLASVYTAINPPPSAMPVNLANKYVVPVPASLAMSPPPVASNNPNSTYIFSESITRSSYQKPQNTYMIQPTKYRAAFTSTRNSTNSKSGKSSANLRKSVKNSEGMPIPMIKPHRHGATLGFNLPDQGLTLYLDINELATKPMAQNIGLKVVSHGKGGEDEEAILNNEVKPLKGNQPNSAKALRKRVTKVIQKIKDNSKNATIATASKSTVVKNSKLQNNERTHTGSFVPLVGSTKKIKFGTKTKSSGSPSKVNIPSPAQANKAKQTIEIPSVNHEISIAPEKLFDEEEKGAFGVVNLTRNDIPPTASRIPATYVSQLEYKEADDDFIDSKDVVVQQRKESESLSDDEEEENDDSAPDLIKEAGTSADAEDDIEREKFPDMSGEVDNETENETETETEGGAENAVRSVNAEDQFVEIEEVDDDESGATTTLAPAELAVTTTVAPSFTTNSPIEESLRVTTITVPVNEKGPDPVVKPSVVNVTTVKKQEAVDNTFVTQMQSLIEKSAQLLEISSQSQQTCSAAVSRCKRNVCEPNFKSLTTDSAMTFREIAHQLEADLILSEVANEKFENEMQDLMDFSTTGYTIFLPSNTAVRRLPPSLLRRWKETGQGLAIDSYILDGAHTLEALAAGKVAETRSKVKLHFGNPHNETFTINGQRVVQANQKAPSGGIVHVIDGLLYPSADKDIIDTLKSCGRLDGFVTLAEGTGFAQILKKDGPFTVFVPSNDALQKVPDNDLELIRRNMTALREFLKYHVAQGIFFSQDLVDGQFLPSLLEGEYLQAGVRVDGCSRRLVEVNVSPLYRADIPASNGVIHVVDWILKPDDRDWCNGVILPRRR